MEAVYIQFIYVIVFHNEHYYNICKSLFRVISMPVIGKVPVTEWAAFHRLRRKLVQVGQGKYL